MKWLLDPNFGVLNYFAKSIGLDLSGIINSEWFPMVSIALINMWIYCGYHMMIFTAGLGNIPETLYDAAKIDGANGFQKTIKNYGPSDAAYDYVFCYYFCDWFVSDF